jgi:hypothetical protein
MSDSKRTDFLPGAQPPRALKSGSDLDWGVSSPAEQIAILRRKLFISRQAIEELTRRVSDKPGS